MIFDEFSFIVDSRHLEDWVKCPTHSSGNWNRRSYLFLRKSFNLKECLCRKKKVGKKSEYRWAYLKSCYKKTLITVRIPFVWIYSEKYFNGYAFSFFSLVFSFTFEESRKKGNKKGEKKIEKLTNKWIHRWNWESKKRISFSNSRFFLLFCV